jgi:hypothetical protein
MTIDSKKVTEPPPRPQSLTSKVYLSKFLDLIRSVFGGSRLVNLLPEIETAINNFQPLQGSEIYLLDYGCGVMEIPIQLKKNGVIKDFIGADIYDAPVAESSSDERWSHYRKLSNEKGAISELLNTFHLVTLIDVLHHVIDDKQKVKILRELSSVSSFILIKDHVEQGFLSRQLLRLADWFGNYSYDVTIPHRYFDQDSWNRLIEEANLQEIVIINKVNVHTGLFRFLIPPNNHFISILAPR